MPPDLQDLQRTLSRVVSPEHVQAGAAAAQLPVDDMVPSLVVRPGTQDEVQQVVAACGSAGAAVTCRGGGTALGAGNPPARLDVVLSLERLTRIVELDDANLNVSVEAGVRLEALQAALAAKREFLPVDPAQADRGTVGGLVATNASGPSRFQHGPVRDWVLGLRVVLPNGERIRCGGKVIKNVTGYDMNKLFIGSLGTLGVVTEATFKLLPLPAARATVVATFAELPAIAPVVTRTLESFLLPDAIDVLEPGAMRSLSAAIAPGLAPMYGLFVAVTGSDETVERQVRDLTRFLAEGGATATARLGDAQASMAWQAIRDVHANLGGAPEQRVIARLSVPIGRTLEMLAAAEGLAKRAGARFAGTSHAGSGIVRAGYVVDGPVDGFRQGLEALRAEAERAEGSLVLDAAPAALKRAMDAWGRPRQALSVMRRLKAEFDPRGLMSPGRFVGGI